MRLLLYQWDAYSERGLKKALQEMNHVVLTYSRKIQNHLLDEEFLKELAPLLVREKVEAVISFDYFPMVSMACKAARIKYISWIFGTPHYSLYSDTVFYEGNYIFCFDRLQYKELAKRGVMHAYHLPLAVDVELFQDSMQCGDAESVKDISFVGTMYTDERNYFEQIPDLPEYILGYVEGICEAQLKLIGSDILEDVLTDDIIKEMGQYINFHMEASYSLTLEQFIKDMIRKKITIMERSRTLGTLAECFDVTAYTNSDTSHLPKLHNGGYIHYYERMPKVFHNSKINLNITMRSIQTGIPLRVLDVLGCGGFLITNYQEEIAERFEDGKDLVMYTSLEDLFVKCQYYLEHEEERQAIARNGYEKVKQEFSYKKQLSYIFDKIEAKKGILIQPMFPEQLKRSDVEKLQWTDAYYRQIDKFYQEIEPKHEQYRQKLNSLLLRKASIVQIADVILEEKYEKLCRSYTDCIMCLTLGQIAMKEETLGIRNIFTRVSSIDEACELMTSLLFGIRRAEHGWADGWEQYMDLLQNRKISYVALVELICHASIVKKIPAATQLAKQLDCYGMRELAFGMLLYLEGQLPYSEEKIMAFTQCYLDLSEPKYAYDILMKYENPKAEILELQQMLGENVNHG